MIFVEIPMGFGKPTQGSTTPPGGMGEFEFLQVDPCQPYVVFVCKWLIPVTSLDPLTECPVTFTDHVFLAFTGCSGVNCPLARQGAHVPHANVNGIELYYEDRGAGRPLVLVHGLGTSSADWQYQYPALESRYRVIAPDQRGFGRSTRPPGPYSIEGYAADLCALLDYLEIDRAHFCGISMGGAVSFQLAVDDPQRVRSLAIINSQPSFELNTFRKRMMAASRRWMARRLGLEREARIQLYRNFPGAANREARRRLQGRFRNDLAPYLAAIDAVAGWTVVDRLDRITAPVLFLAGEHDFTPPQEKAAFAALMSNARVQAFPGARHAMHLQKPDEVNAALLAFFGEVDAG